jgi:hypothetical protein
VARQTALRHLTDALDTAAGRTQDLVGDTKSRAKGLSRDAKRRAKGLRSDARTRAKGLRSDAQSLSKETRRRTSAARDALAGKRSHPWRWVAAAAAAGIGAGAAAVTFLRRLLMMREQRQLADVEATVAAHAAAAERSTARVNGYAAETVATPSRTATAVSPKPTTPGTVPGPNPID